MKTAISKEVLDFLKKLKKNNDRDWFAANKKEYLSIHENVIAFADGVVEGMSKVDNIETVSGKKSLYRIYRDTRFSNDKTPYKSHFGGVLKRATKQLRGGYYFHIEAGHSFVGGGFWDPNPDDLKRIRKAIAEDPDELRKIINSKAFISTFGTLKGDQVKSAPKGYKKEDPAIDLLRYKQFLISKEFTDQEVLAPDYADKVIATFNAMRPFFDYMSYILTTDANGEPLYKD
jgi:uncharacterized protein (TIGR02453 family)